MTVFVNSVFCIY